jgi:hypothetical protein
MGTGLDILWDLSKYIPYRDAPDGKFGFRYVAAVGLQQGGFMLSLWPLLSRSLLDNGGGCCVFVTYIPVRSRVTDVSEDESPTTSHILQCDSRESNWCKKAHGVAMRSKSICNIQRRYVVNNKRKKHRPFAWDVWKVWDPSRNATDSSFHSACAEEMTFRTSQVHRVHPLTVASWFSDIKAERLYHFHITLRATSQKPQKIGVAQPVITPVLGILQNPRLERHRNSARTPRSPCFGFCRQLWQLGELGSLCSSCRLLI